MTVTRRVVSDSYIKPNNTQYETRRVISNEYLKPTGVPIGGAYCGRTVTRTPVYTRYPTPQPVYVNPPVYINPQPNCEPVFVSSTPTYVASDCENMVAALLVTAAVVGFVALIALVPHCHKEEICTDLFNGFSGCHIEEVCRRSYF